MIPKVKRAIMWPFISIYRKRKLYRDIMLPEQIRDKEKEFHQIVVEANRKGMKDIEREYTNKRDALRMVLKIG